jgi:hypothetical protein
MRILCLQCMPFSPAGQVQYADRLLPFRLNETRYGSGADPWTKNSTVSMLFVRADHADITGSPQSFYELWTRAGTLSSRM